MHPAFPGIMLKSHPKRKKRRLTPASDTESVVIPVDPHASPPPSQVQPIIRQAVGFGSALEQSAAAIPMYRATVPEQPADRYLPGQTIGQPLPPTPVLDDFRHPEDRAADYRAPGERKFQFTAYDPHGHGGSSSDGVGPSRTRGKSKTSTRKKKNKSNEAFAGQVDKFRVSYNMGYTLPSSTESNYSGSPHHTATSMDTPSSNASPRATMPSIVPDYSLFLKSPTTDGSAQSQAPTNYSRESSLTTSRGKGKGKSKAARESAKATDRAPFKSSTATSETLSARRAEKQPARDGPSPTPSNDPSKTDYSKYYRFDYEQQRAITPDHRPTPPPGYPSHATPQATSPAPGNGGHGQNHMSPVAAGSSGTSSRLSVSSSKGEATRPPHNPPLNQQHPPASMPLRMVTLLIEDFRSGMQDHQIAEVRVHLRQHDDPDSGFWANAREIAEQLQSSPSRVDGPARVFSMRGKYRQFFLRVDKNNMDTIANANLAVDVDRSLEVFVEEPPQDGKILPPPVVAHDPESDEELQALTSRGPIEEHQRNEPPRDSDSKRRRGMSNSSYASSVQQPSLYSSYASPTSLMSPRYSGRSPSPGGYQSSLHGTPSKKAKTSSYPWQQTTSEQAFTSVQPSLSHATTRPTHYMPLNTPSAANPGITLPNRDEINAAIVKWLKPSIEEHNDWLAYMKSKASALTASVIVLQYRFVQGRIEFYQGATTPPDLPVAPKQRIGKSHVLKALNLTTQWGAECAETLKLLDRYGPQGTRYTDSRIVDILSEDPKKGPLPPGSAPKRLLNLLRDIHNDWTTDHPEDVD